MLEHFDADSVVKFYEDVQSKGEGYLIALNPFDAIVLDLGYEGLCLCCLGVKKYETMQRALFVLLQQLLAKAPTCLSFYISSVGRNHKNGFMIMWRLLQLTVPGFHKSKTIDKPLWLSYERDLFKFAAAIELYFRLLRKKNQFSTDYTRSALFLNGIEEETYRSVTDSLLTSIGSWVPQEFDTAGSLPPNLQVTELAQTIQTRCKVEHSDPGVASGTPSRRIFKAAGDVMESDELLADTFGLTDDTYLDSTEGHMQGFVPTDMEARRQDGSQLRRQDGSPFRRTAQRGGPPGGQRPQRNRFSQNTRYARRPNPGQRRRPPLPANTICAACGRPRHTANTCDFLGMALHLGKYIDDGMDPTVIADCEKRWLEKFRQHLGTPTRTPRQVLKAYCEATNLSEDQIEDEMDWMCWDANPQEE